MESHRDFIIIGSGFGGSVSALRLAEKGYAVQVLEMGRRYRTEDFPKTNWNLKKYLWMPVARCFGIQALTFLRDVFILHGVGVGGGSLVYANTHLVPPQAFFDDPRWSHIRDWKTELAPYYDLAMKMLGSNQVKAGPETDDMLLEIAKDMGREKTFHRPTVGVFFGEPGVTVSDPYFGGKGPDRTGCTLCGGCMVGCRFGAKNTLDKNYLYLAEQLGVEIVPERKAVDIRPMTGGGYEVFTESSTAWGQKDYRRHTASNVIVSAGVLGTVRLLMDCRDRGSLPNVSNQIGNFVRTNSEALLGATSRRKDVDYSKGVAISSGFHPDDSTHIEVVRYSKGSDSMAMLGTLLTDGGPPYPRFLRFLGNILRHPLQFLWTLWPFGWAHRTAILLVMQPVNNYLRLRKRKTWFGGEKLDSDRGDGPKVPTYIPMANDVARRLAKKMDGIPQSVLPEVIFDLSSTAHILGGCPIGGTPEEGVIDEQCKVFGYEGLYVVDGSIIPANLGVNPSLTITALSERAMTFIPEKRKKEE